LGLALGADEQDGLALGGERGRKLFRLTEQLRRLRQVDDVDPVPLAEDVGLHLRVPALGLVSEVDARLEQILQRDAAQAPSITHSELPVPAPAGNWEVVLP